jgi:hypothetical protein
VFWLVACLCVCVLVCVACCLVALLFRVVGHSGVTYLLFVVLMCPSDGDGDGGRGTRVRVLTLPFDHSAIRCPSLFVIMSLRLFWSYCFKPSEGATDG